jgi:hypothetical protein
MKDNSMAHARLPLRRFWSAEPARARPVANDRCALWVRQTSFFVSTRDPRVKAVVSQGGNFDSRRLAESNT